MLSSIQIYIDELKKNLAVYLNPGLSKNNSTLVCLGKKNYKVPCRFPCFCMRSVTLAAQSEAASITQVKICSCQTVILLCLISFRGNKGRQK